MASQDAAAAAAAAPACNAPPSSSSFYSLDTDTVALILGRLSYQALAACACVSRSLQQLAEEPALWERALAAYEPSSARHAAVAAALDNDPRAYLRQRVEFWRESPGKGASFLPASRPHNSPCRRPSCAELRPPHSHPY
jgi:hypothetical protein